MLITAGAVGYRWLDPLTTDKSGLRSIGPLRPVSTIAWPYDRSQFKGFQSVIVDDAIYVVGEVDGVAQIARADLRTGTVVWQQPVGETLAFGLNVADGLLVLGGETGAGGSIVTVYRAADGAQLWMREDSLELVSIGGGSALFRRRLDHQGPDLQMTVADTGQVRWTSSVASSIVSSGTGAEPSRIVSVGNTSPRGGPLGNQVIEYPLAMDKLSIRDTVSGRVIASVKVQPADDRGDPTMMTVSDRTVVVTRMTRSPTLELHGYSTTDLSLRWILPLQVGKDLLENPIFGVTACAAGLVCTFVPSSTGGFIAIDAATGRERWRSPVFAQPIRGTTNLVTAVGQNSTVLLDPATGRVLHDFTSGSIHSHGDRVLSLVQKVTAPGVNRTQAELFQAGHDGLVNLGELPTLPELCRSSPKYLACVTDTEKLQVWELP